MSASDERPHAGSDQLGDVEIRSGGERDADAVLELWRAAGGEPTVTDTREGVIGLVLTAPGALLVAERGGAIVGSLIASFDGWRGSFYRLAVHPDMRRRGLASALVRAGEQRLRQLGAIRLTAIVVDTDPVAMGFWRSAGYAQQRQRARFVRAIER